ncbi:MAG: rRNA maturation RNase YbeY [Acidobacteriota bacterium]
MFVTDALGRATAARGLGRWLERAAPGSARGVVSIALVSDAAIRRLNRRYRRIDRVTDVLSFPASRPPHPQTPVFLGDLAIALGVARRQAREQGHGLPRELRILALHGLLHLLGYDHETDQGEMQRLEERLRRRAGLPPGLITRFRRRRLQ